VTKRITEPGEPRNDLPGEEWKPVPGYETLYEFSNLGRVFRMTRLGSDGRTPQEVLAALPKRRKSRKSKNGSGD